MLVFTKVGAPSDEPPPLVLGASRASFSSVISYKLKVEVPPMSEVMAMPVPKIPDDWENPAGTESSKLTAANVIIEFVFIKLM